MSKTKHELPQQVFVVAESRIKRRHLIAAAVVVAVIAITAAGMYFVFRKTGVITPKRDTSQVTPKGGAVTVAKVDQLKYSGKQAEAIDLTKQKIEASKDAHEEAYYTFELGTLYESKGDFKNALDSYKKVEAMNDPQMNVASGIARSYEGLGDKANAIKYYKIAYEKVDRNLMGYQAKLDWFRDKITDLGGTL